METTNKLKVIINADTQQYDRALNSAANKVLSFSKVITGVAVGAGMGAFLGNAIKQTAEFEKEFARLTTLIKTGSMDTGALRAEYLKLGNGVGDVTEIVKAAYSALSGNVAPAKSVQFMADVVRFAKGNMIDFDAATKTVVGVLNTFGSKAGTTREILDALTRTIQIGQMTGGEYAEAIGRILPQANALGVSFKDLNSTLTVLTSSNIKITEAVTYLRALLINVAKPGREVRDTINNLGLEFSQAALRSKGLGGFLQDLVGKIKGNEDAMIKLFGSVEAFNAVAVLTTKEGLALLKKNQDEIAGSAGAMMDAYAKVKDTLLATIGGIQSAIKAQTISATLPVVEALKNLLKENKGAVLELTGALIGAISQAIQIILKLHDVIILAGKALVIYFIASKAGMAINGIGAAVGRLIEYISKLTTAYVTQGLAADAANAKTAAGMKGLLASQFPALAQNVKGLGGLLSNLGPIAIAAFAGWELGKLINDTLGLGDAIQGVVDKLQLTVEEQAKLSKVEGFGIEKFNDALEKMQGFGVDAEINKIAAAFKLTGADILATTTAVYNNRDAFNALSPAAQAFLRSAEGFDAYAKSTAREELRNSILEIGKSLGATSSRMSENALAIKGNEKAYAGLNDEQKKYVDGVAGSIGAVKDQKKAADELQKAVKADSDAVTKLKDDLGILNADGLARNSSNIKAVMGLYDQYKSRLVNNNEAIEKWIKKIDELSESALPGEVESLKELKEEILSLKDNTEQITKLNQGLLDSISDMSTKFSKTGFFSNILNQEQYRAVIDDSITDWENYTGKVAALVVSMAGIFPGAFGAIVAENNNLHYQLRSEMSKSEKALQDFRNDLIVTGEALGVMGDILGALGDIFPGLTDELQSAGQAMNSLGKISTSFSKILEGGFQNVATGVLGVVSAIPSLISALKKLFAGNGIGQETDRNLRTLSGLTEDWRKEINDLAESMTGADRAGRAYNATLADIIDNSEITVDNFYQYAQAVNDIVNAYEEGNATLGETQRNFNAAFEALLRKARELGMESDSWIFQLRALADAFGLDIDAIDRQLNELIQSGVDGFRKMKEALSTKDLTEDLTALYAELNDPENKPDPERYVELIDQIKKIQDEIAVLNSLSTLFQKNTFSQFEELYNFEEKVAANKSVVDAIQGWGEQLIAFTKLNKVSADDFAGYMSTVAGEVSTLAGQGFSEIDIVKILGPQLSQLNFLASEYGFKIDDATQKLIDMGLKTGDVTTDFRTDNQKVVDGLGDLGGKLDKILAAIEEGNTRPSAAGDIPGFATGTGGVYVNTPSIFAVGEKGPEMVQFQGGGSKMKVTPVGAGNGNTANFNITIMALDSKSVRDFMYSEQFNRYLSTVFGQRGLRS